MAPAISLTLASPTPTFTPALKPPPGVISNPDNPPSLAYQTKLAIGISVPLLTIFFLSRAYVRIVIKRVWIFEDWIAFTAWAGSIAYMGIMGATMANHGGQHAWDITAADAKDAAYWFNVASIEYGIIVCITKLAVLCLYRRFFSPVKWSPLDISIVALIVILTGFYGITSFVKIFECTPRARIVDKTVPGHCIDVPTLLNTSGSFNTVTDFLILLLPVHAVWNMHLTKVKKTFVVLVFTFGLCAPIFSMIGFIVRIRISGNPDTTWNQPEILLWGAAELTSGNLVVSFPEMGALFNRRVRSQSRPIRPSDSMLASFAARTRQFRASNSGRDPDMCVYEMDEENLDKPMSSHSRLYSGSVQVSHEITVDFERVKNTK